MASSSSSSTAAIPATSASNEISLVEENTNQTQNQVTSTENTKNKKKHSFFSNLFKPNNKKQKPTEENVPNPEEEERKKDAEKRQKETEKEVKAITSMIKADFHTIDKAVERINNNKEVFKSVKNKFELLIKDHPNDEMLEGQERNQAFCELTASDAKDLREFKNVVKTLKQQIFTHGKKHDIRDERMMLRVLEAILNAKKEVVNKEQLEMMPNLFADPNFERTLQFKDFKAQYDGLPLELKLCLLCFAVFPEDVEIKRRVLLYWWIGEGFVSSKKLSQENTNTLENNTDTEEHRANRYFEKLLNMGFFESAEKKPSKKVDVVKMHPFVRTMVNMIAQKAEFFEFDDDGNVGGKGKFSKSLRACLLDGNNTLTKEERADEKKKDELTQRREKEYGKLLKNLHAIVNVDEAILDFKRDSLSKMENVNVLYLGRWQNSGTHHIEVDDSKILDASKGNLLDGLEHIKYLKFLSLQGISRITELPKSITKLQHLTILDIRSCHNLEKIPNDIGYLVNLTHLDMSDCFLLDEMPKGISKLIKLQVLSGFVVLEPANKKSCLLSDLKDFPDLRKLSIHTGSNKFPEEKDLKALNQFQKLSKLTIAWGRGSVNGQTQKKNEDDKEESNKGSMGTDEQDKKERSGDVTKEPDTGDQDNNQILEEENLGESTKKPDTSDQDKDQILETKSSREITKEPDTGDQDNNQISEEENLEESTKKPDMGDQDNNQISETENSGESTNEPNTGDQDKDQITGKENSGDVTKGPDTSDQNNNQISENKNLGDVTKEPDTGDKDNNQISKKENLGEITKEPDMGDEDNNQILEKENLGEVTKEPDTGDNDNNRISEKENSGEITKDSDTREQDNNQISEKENSGEVTKEPDTGDKDNNQILEKEYLGEITKEPDTGDKDNNQISEKEDSEEITEEPDSGDQDNNQILEKENSEEVTREPDTGDQDNNQILEKENSGEITEEPDTGNQDQVGNKNGNVLKNRDRENNKSQEKNSLNKIKGLLDRSLKNPFFKKATTGNDEVQAELPSQLTKLDFQCLPETTDNWLRPEKLKNLKKLYIRGGKLSDLGQFHDLDDSSSKQTWENVTELRLKYLDDVEMEWKELLEIFPKLEYLEKVHCPKLSFFPCNEIGVWKKKIS